MREPKGCRGFIVRFVGQSDTKPARVRIWDTRNNVGVYLSYNYHGTASEQAQEHLESLGISVDGIMPTQAGLFLISENFDIKLTKAVNNG
jgi:hypothetical protein